MYLSRARLMEPEKASIRETLAQALFMSGRIAWARYDCFLLDLDGVLYRADEPIPGAGEVIEGLRGLGARLVFVTNNSSKSPDQVAEKLERMDIRASPDEIVTSALATAAFVSRSG